jgi:hypothetical protein
LQASKKIDIYDGNEIWGEIMRLRDKQDVLAMWYNLAKWNKTD